MVQQVPPSIVAGTGPPDECSSPEVLPQGKGMSSSVSYVHMISKVSFRVPSGCTGCPGSVVLEGDMAGGGGECGFARWQELQDIPHSYVGLQAEVGAIGPIFRTPKRA